jgi:hypothetical protein
LNPTQQQQNSGGSKSKKKYQKGSASDGSKTSGDKNGNNLQLAVASGHGPVMDPKFKNVTYMEKLAIMWVSTQESKGASFAVILDITWISA